MKFIQLALFVIQFALFFVSIIFAFAIPTIEAKKKIVKDCQTIGAFSFNGQAFDCRPREKHEGGAK